MRTVLDCAQQRANKSGTAFTGNITHRCRREQKSAASRSPMSRRPGEAVRVLGWVPGWVKEWAPVCGQAQGPARALEAAGATPGTRRACRYGLGVRALVCSATAGPIEGMLLIAFARSIQAFRDLVAAAVGALLPDLSLRCAPFRAGVVADA